MFFTQSTDKFLFIIDLGVGKKYIDDFIAHEIGWTDRNNNNVLDVDEYKEYCVKNREDSGKTWKKDELY